MAANDTALTVTRPVQKYITPDFRYKWGWAVASHTDGNVRLFATNDQSLYIAKIPWSEMENTSKVSSQDCDHVFYLMTFPVAPLAHSFQNTDMYTQVHLLEQHKLVQ